MTEDRQFSRPARLAAHLIKKGDIEAAQMFSKSRVLLRIEEQFEPLRDARETLLFAANQILRFCPNVSVQMSQTSTTLLQDLQNLKHDIHGGDHDPIATISSDRQIADFDAILNIGTGVVHKLPWVTINSSGWVARAATAGAETNQLFWTTAPCNPCGALAAACLGAGLIFLTILNQQPALLREFSMFTHSEGAPGSLETGPSLPHVDLNLEAFLVGCGAVSNGWAYAVKRLPITGQIQAIDKQSLKFENFGPYVLAGCSFLDRAKVDRIQDYLAPKIAVIPRADEWELFKIRIRFGLAVPPPHHQRSRQCLNEAFSATALAYNAD